jgi:hypothetical protein
MTNERKNFDIIPFPHAKIVDTEAISSLNENDHLSFLSSNRETFEGGKELFVDGCYYGVVSFMENGNPFTLLTPYRINMLKYPKKNFGFGVYDNSTNKLFMFFNGVATTDSRSTAIMVYNSLVQYCKTTNPNYHPFAIKL